MDFLPASLAAIVSYFSAEITRGIWKAVPMNGTEWPSPGAALHSIEDEVKEILASAGVQIHSCYPRTTCLLLLCIKLVAYVHTIAVDSLQTFSIIIAQFYYIFICLCLCITFTFYSYRWCATNASFTNGCTCQLDYYV